MERYLPVYTGASCNHFVYTAWTFGYINGQSASLKERKEVDMQLKQRKKYAKSQRTFEYAACGLKVQVNLLV